MEQSFDMTGEETKLGERLPSVMLPPDVVSVAPPATMQDRLNLVPEHESMLPTILEKIHDSNYPLEEVNRLIAIEIAFVTQEMGRLRGQVKLGNHSETFLQKSYEQQVKALQALEKSLTSTDILRHRDILNFDGPKFQYVFGELVNLFKKACQDALGRDNDTMVQSIMKHYRDELAMREADMRHEVEKIDFKGKK
jgi:hypothetical protein